MSRVINPERAGQDRARLLREIVLALRQLSRQQEIDAETKDMIAFIALALKAVWNSIETSTAPWEKRGYWIKADRFRIEWMWTQKLGFELQSALFSEDWEKAAMISGQIAAKLANVKVPTRHPATSPWVGAWQHIMAQPGWSGNSG